MINGIGSLYSSYYNYQLTINQMRQQQALARNPETQRTIKPVSREDDYGDEYRRSGLNFLRDYSSRMSDVMQAANSLKTGNSVGVMNSLAVSSSDTGVAEVTNRYTIRSEKEITMEVYQLAAAQRNRSEGVKSSESASGDMDFAISGKNGSFSIHVSASDENGRVRTNGEMLREAAAAINQSHAGVKATVTQQDGEAFLSVESDTTGTNSAFTVTGQLGAAAGLENAEQEALNAQYSITANGNSINYTSQTNSVRVDGGRMQAELKGAGETIISAGPDAEKVASAVSDLLDSYNKAVSFLEDNVNHGKGTVWQLERLERSLGSEQSLAKLGISKNEEGNLVLDKEVLKKSLAEEPDLTKELLSGSNGLAQNAFDRGVSAMGANSASLISNDLSAIDNSFVVDPFQYMGMYSRSGAYTMNNYAALGLMMNYLV